MEDIRKARRWAGDRAEETDSDLEERKVTQRTEGEGKDRRRVGKGTKVGEREPREGKEARGQNESEEVPSGSGRGNRSQKGGQTRPGER